jgi:hypothetical protein
LALQGSRWSHTSGGKKQMKEKHSCCWSSTCLVILRSLIISDHWSIPGKWKIWSMSLKY